jgi:large subunit ribosomal protein L24
VKKHVKSTQEFKGGIFTKESPVHYSKVSLIDPTSGYNNHQIKYSHNRQPTKVSIKFLEDGSKVRIGRATGTVIPKPEPTAYLKRRKDQEARGDGPKDTPIEIAKKKTFVPPSIEDLD